MKIVGLGIRRKKGGLYDVFPGNSACELIVFGGLCLSKSFLIRELGMWHKVGEWPAEATNGIWNELRRQ